MRILTEEEMDRVFGGDDNIKTTTMSTVNVTAVRTTSDYNTSSFGTQYMGRFTENETGSPSGAAYMYPMTPWTYVSQAKLKCMIDASVAVGQTAPPGWNYLYVNAWTYTNSSLNKDYYFSGAAEPSTGTTYSNQVPPDAIMLRGRAIVKEGSSENIPGTSRWRWTQGAVTLYGHAFQASTGPAYSHEYHDEIGQVMSPKPLGYLSQLENMLMVGAHETRHAHQLYSGSYMGNDVDERDAETEAIKALERYRANKAAIDAACKNK